MMMSWRVSRCCGIVLLVSLAACRDTLTPDEAISRSVQTLELGLSTFGEAIAGTPDGGFVSWTGNRTGSLQSVSAFTRDGVRLWTAAVDICQVGPCVLSVDATGDIYIPTRSGLVALSRTGTLRWRVAANYVGSLSIGRGSRLYFVAGVYDAPYPTLYAVDKATGDIVWQIPQIPGSPDKLLLDEANNSLYALAFNRLRSLDPASGAEKWRVGPLCFGQGALAHDGTVYITCGGTVSAYTASGTLKWTTKITGGGFRPVIDENGTVYVVYDNGATAVSSSGRVIWHYEVNEGGLIASTDPVVDAAHDLYIVDRFDSSTAPTIVRIHNGIRQTSIVRADTPHGRALLIMPDGRVLFNSAGNLISFQSAGSRDDAPWPTMGGDPGRTWRR